MRLDKIPLMDEDDMVAQLESYEELCNFYEDYIQVLENEEGFSYLVRRRLRAKIDAARENVDKY